MTPVPAASPGRATASGRRARSFLFAFAAVLAVALVPALALSARLVSLGEILDDTPATVVAVRGTLFSDYPEYKLRETMRRRADVLVLGSSRASHIRETFFSGCHERPGCFYNAAGALPNLSTGLAFLRDVIAEAPPELLLLALDEWHFNPNFELVASGRVEPLRSDPLRRLDPSFTVVKRIAALALEDARLRALLIDPRPTPGEVRGIKAHIDGSGFRPDGSHRYPPDWVALRSTLSGAERSREWATQARTGGYRFEPFDGPDGGALRALEQILDLAAERGVRVIGFTTPLSDEVSRAVAENHELDAGVRAAAAALTAAFARRGVPFAAFRDAAAVGCMEEENLDGIHLGEVCTARLLLKLTELPGAAPLLRPYASGEHLGRLIDQRPSSLTIEP